MEPAAGGDEVAPPRPDVHCWESTADAKPGFDKQTDTKDNFGPVAVCTIKPSRRDSDLTSAQVV